MCRTPCKECPWKNDDQHSLKFRTYVDKMRNLGRIKNHKCHMISSDVWGSKSNVDDKNVCIGSINFIDKKS